MRGANKQHTRLDGTDNGHGHTSADKRRADSGDIMNCGMHLSSDWNPADTVQPPPHHLMKNSVQPDCLIKQDYSSHKHIDRMSSDERRAADRPSAMNRSHFACHAVRYVLYVPIGTRNSGIPILSNIRNSHFVQYTTRNLFGQGQQALDNFGKPY